MRKKTFLFSCIIAAAANFLAPCVYAAETATETAVTVPGAQESQAAALAWLKYVDQGNYGESWEKSSGILKLTVGKEEWTRILAAMRKPLGNVSSRTLSEQRPAENPRGLPPGQYMVLFYTTNFSNKNNAHELITMVLEGGEWRVLTYHVN